MEMTPELIALINEDSARISKQPGLKTCLLTLINMGKIEVLSLSEETGRPIYTAVK